MESATIKKMHSDNSITHLNSVEISNIKQSIVLLFCFNTIVVLVHFIRKRVRLSFEIRRIPADQLVRKARTILRNLRQL